MDDFYSGDIYSLILVKKDKTADFLGKYSGNEAGFKRLVKDYRHFSQFAKDNNLPEPLPVKYVTRKDLTMILSLTLPFFSIKTREKLQ